MSASPQDDPAENRDELGPADESGTADAHQVPVKRGRGRPKGSKNKKTGEGSSAVASDTPKKKRGRPPKEKKDESGQDGEPAPKRKRGRPPKTKAEEAGGEGSEAAASTEKKRGRPSKKDD